MNREQKRKLIKNKKELTAFVKSFEGVKDQNLIPEGTKVKLNYKQISSRPDYSTNLSRWHDFVELHKDDVFTVEYDSKRKKDPYLVCFKEDDSPIKWLWLVTDLIRVKEDN
jgi:hypothetical protein